VECRCVYRSTLDSGASSMCDNNNSVLCCTESTPTMYEQIEPSHSRACLGGGTGAVRGEG
jgi:hypothetical protein